MKALMNLEILALITMMLPARKYLEAKGARIRRSTDILCNVGSRFECVCLVQDGSLLTSPKHKLCYTFIKSGTLASVRLSLSHFGSLDTLSAENKVALEDGTPVTYEYYFRYHIAKLLTKHCVEDTNRCKNVGLSVKPASVFIIRITSGAENGIIVDYTTARSYDAAVLDPTVTVAPELILKAVGPSLHTFIPYPVLEHQPYTFHVPYSGPSVWEENIGLITALIIFACVLVLIYIIAIIKAVRDRSKRSRPSTSTSKKESTSAVPVPKTSQYGSTDQRSQTVRATLEEEQQPIYEPVPVKPITIKVTQVQDTPASETEQLIQNGPSQKPEKPSPRRFSSTLSQSVKKITESQSLQFSHLVENGPQKKAKTFKKAVTCYFPLHSRHGDQESDTRSLVEDTSFKESDLTQRDGMVLSTDGALPNGTHSNQGGSKVISIPVLIVPAMSTYRNDGDYVKIEDYEEDEAAEEKTCASESAKASGWGLSTKDNGLKQTISEENLLSSELNGSGSIYEENSSSSETISDDDDGPPSPRAFDVNYQPLRESSWSVNRIMANQNGEPDMNLTDHE